MPSVDIQFYAYLYTGLYYEAWGDTERALRQITEAADDRFAAQGYRLHARSGTRASRPAKPSEAKDPMKIVLAAQPPAAESKRPATETASGDDYNGDAMLTFEHAPNADAKTEVVADIRARARSWADHLGDY